jgi:dienelactone hydrolase
MDAVPNFTTTQFVFGGKTRPVFRRGSGPAVIVIHEVPGITPQVAAFANRVADAGFTVYLPHLFGEPMKPVSMATSSAQWRDAVSAANFACLPPISPVLSSIGCARWRGRRIRNAAVRGSELWGCV